MAGSAMDGTASGYGIVERSADESDAARLLEPLADRAWRVSRATDSPLATLSRGEWSVSTR